MDEKEKQQAIAVFKYGLIAPVLHMTGAQRNKYLQELSCKDFDVPHLGRKKYCVKTFKNWLLQYKDAGIDALKPSFRTDKGTPRKISDRIDISIRQIISQFPKLPTAGIYRMLIKNKVIDSSDLSENTLRKYIREHNLKEDDNPRTPRKKFEKENVNELWVTDFMHGVYIREGRKKKRKTYLCAIIDDHSRMIVGWEWAFQDDSVTLANALKNAISVYGAPNVIYCDNGRVFATNYLQMICAKLGIALVHSKPYDPSGRGKVERFFNTVRSNFLACVYSSTISFQLLRDTFEEWLETGYHQKFHSGINESPSERYLNNIEKTKIKTISKQEIDNVFLYPLSRTVKNDSTISINRKLYELPPEYIGKKVNLAFPIDNPEKIYLLDEDDKPVLLLKQVNLSENASKPYTAIHFKNLNEGGKSDD